MNILNILEKGEALLPILIFIIWAVLSALGAATKGKKPPPKQAPAPSPHNGGDKSTGISDELRHTLDVIFGTPSESPKPKQTRSAPPQAANEKKTVQKTLEKVVGESRAKKAPPQVQAAAKAEPRERSPLPTHISADEAAKGVIWSEILQPPVSMRF